MPKRKKELKSEKDEILGKEEIGTGGWGENVRLVSFLGGNGLGWPSEFISEFLEI